MEEVIIRATCLLEKLQEKILRVGFRLGWKGKILKEFREM
jgi:hypothetical protein